MTCTALKNDAQTPLSPDEFENGLALSSLSHIRVSLPYFGLDIMAYFLVSQRSKLSPAPGFPGLVDLPSDCPVVFTEHHFHILFPLYNKLCLYS